MKAREVIVSAIYDVDTRSLTPEEKALCPLEDDPWIIEAADGVLSALDAAGYVVVPKEPTEAMVKAGRETLTDKTDWDTWHEEATPYYDTGYMEAIYHAIVAAAEKESKG